MKKLVSILSVVLIVFSYCTKSKIAYGISHCIRHKVKTFKKNAHCSDARVEEYEFQSDGAYVFNNGTCSSDSITLVYDSKCNYIGQLGGTNGNTIIKGQDFYSTAKFIRLVWEK